MDNLREVLENVENYDIPRQNVGKPGDMSNFIKGLSFLNVLTMGIAAYYLYANNIVKISENEISVNLVNVLTENISFCVTIISLCFEAIWIALLNFRRKIPSWRSDSALFNTLFFITSIINILLIVVFGYIFYYAVISQNYHWGEIRSIIEINSPFYIFPLFLAVAFNLMLPFLADMEIKYAQNRGMSDKEKQIMFLDELDNKSFGLVSLLFTESIKRHSKNKDPHRK